jgi:cation diffusion facilitator CzcD-associated flavoprotein CzcO
VSAADFHGEVLVGDAWRGQDFRGQNVALVGPCRDVAVALAEVAWTASRVSVFLEDATWVLPDLPGPFDHLVGLGSRLPTVGVPAGRAAARAHLRLAVRDPWLRRQLTPHPRFGSRRATTGAAFYVALQAPHCKLFTWPVYAVVPEGLRSVEGIEHHVDCIVVAGDGHLPEARLNTRHAVTTARREDRSA